MNEHSFRKSFERNLKKELSWIWKIHDAFAGGVLDAYYEGYKNDLWVEYKWVNLPKRNTTIIDLSNPDKYLSKLQQRWIHRRVALKRDDVVVIAGHAQGCNLYFNEEWLEPRTREDFLARSVSVKEARNKLLTLLN